MVSGANQVSEKRKRADSRCSICKKVGHTKPTCPQGDKRLVNAKKRRRTNLPRNGVLSAEDDSDSFDSDMDEEVGVSPTCNGVNDECGPSGDFARASDDDNGDETVELDSDADANDCETIHVDLEHCADLRTREHRSGQIIDLSGDDLPSNEHKPKYVNKDRVFEGLKDVPAEVHSEADFLALFWTEEIWVTLVENTNSYALNMGEKGLGVEKWRPVTMIEMKKFFGLMAFFGFIQVPERRDLWNQNSRLYNAFLANCMSRHRF